MYPLFVLFAASSAVVVLILRFRINAFLALMIAGLLVGLLTPEIPLDKKVSEVTTRFGSFVGRIGLMIAMASVVGHAMMQSGAAERITRTFLRWFGEKRAALSMVSSGSLLSIPVFADTVFYLLIPLARSMSVRMGGKHLLRNVLAISAGATASHMLVPPTPGPLMLAATLELDVGLVMLVGLPIALCASAGGYVYACWIDRRLNLPMREAPGLALEELGRVAQRSDDELPGFGAALLPIALPVTLIALGTTLKMAGATGAWAQVLFMLGDPNVALTLAAAVALALTARKEGRSVRELSASMEAAVKDGGMIILITAGGGAFGGMLQLAGVGDALGELAKATGVTVMVMGFLVASLFKVAQGSSTVAMITSAAIVLPVVQATELPYHTVYLAPAIGAGSLVGLWMNDSGFWVYRTMTGLTEVETLKGKSVMLAVMGCCAFAATLVASTVLPLK